MIRRRQDRLAAALLLTALLASLSLLAHPSGKAAATVSVPSLDVSATVRYGCAQDGAPAFAEVELARRVALASGSNAPVLQLGLTGPLHSVGKGAVGDSNPSLITLTSERLLVRLAGVPKSGDKIAVIRIDQPGALPALTLPSRCSHVDPTEFGINVPDVTVTNKSTCHGTTAAFNVNITNVNPIGERLRQLGYDQLDYTVLLVRHSDGSLVGSPSSGRMVSFVPDGPTKQTTTINQPASKADTYEPRIVGPDGSVEYPGNFLLSCNGVDPHPSPTRTFTPVPTATASASVTPPVSTSPSHSRPTQSSTAVAPVPATTATSSAARPTPTPTATATDQPIAAPQTQAVGDQQAIGQAEATSQAATVAKAPGSRKPTPSPSKSKQTSNDPPAAIATATAALGLGRALSGPALLVLIVFAVAMAGLVGNTVRNARRR